MEKKEKSDEVIRLTDIGKSYYIGKQEVPVLTRSILRSPRGSLSLSWGLRAPENRR